MAKGIFFDLDGTLLDTLGDIHAYVNQMLRAFSYPEITLMQTRAYVGDGARKLIERSVPENCQNFDECYAFFSNSFKSSDNELTKLYAGERETLERLKKRGIKLAVITNKPQIAAERCLKKFFGNNFFDFIGGDSGMFECKPDPSLARYAALKLKLSPREIVFVGDGEADVLTAKNAGMRCISVLWGYRTKEQLEKVGAREFAESFQSLEEILF